MRFFFIFATVFFLPILVFAAEGDFNALAPIPGITTDDSGQTITSLPQYINNVFDFAILIGAILALFQLVRAGFMYMTTEALFEKKESRKLIADAIFGLIILLSITLILQTVNKNIINLDLLNFNDLRNQELQEVRINGAGVPTSGDAVTVTRENTRWWDKVLATQGDFLYGMPQEQCPEQIQGRRTITANYVADLERSLPVSECAPDPSVRSCCVYEAYKSGD